MPAPTATTDHLFDNIGAMDTKTPRGARAAWAAMEQGKHLCACGCGTAITVRAEHYPRPPSYVLGHNRLGKRKPRPERRPCACRCGLLAQPGKDFISGHNRRGESHTPETLRRLSEAKLGPLNPQYGKEPVRARPRVECACGCGMLTSRGRRYVTGHNTRRTRMSNYRGWFQAGPYIRVHAEDHPFASDGYVLHHRLVVEQHLRVVDPESQYLMRLGNQLYLRPEIVVHHRDGVKDNNEIENLEPMTGDEHVALHHQQGDIRRH